METTNNSDNLSNENNSLCRVCLSANKDNKCIFNFHINLDHEICSSTTLWEKLQFYGDIEVSQDDGLPGKICNQCISKIRVAHEFRTQCQATDKMLRSIHSNSTDKNVSASGCWVKLLRNESEREYTQNDEIEKLEELYSDESDEYTAVEISRPNKVLQNTENDVSYCINKTDDVKSTTKKQESQTRTILVLKKVNSNTVDKPYQVYEKSNSALEKGRRSGSLVEDSMNDISGDVTKIKEGKSISRKEGYQSRRFVLFKRATSMTNLKNNKERQRKYIKKTLFTKLESNDPDNVQNSNTLCTSGRQLSTKVNSLHFKCSKCGRSYSSKKALEMHENCHERKKFSCDQCHERFDRFDDFLKHAKTHDPNDKLEPASCKICKKNFKKAVTMVRHLNVHKRENPRVVYSILKDIRDRRKSKSVKMSGEDKVNAENLEEKKIVLHNPKSTRITRKLRKTKSELQENRVCIPEMANADLHCEDHTKSFAKRHSSSHEDMNFTCDMCNMKFVVGDQLKCHREQCIYYKDNTRWEQSPPDDRSAIKLINIWIKEELDSDNEGRGFPCNNCSKSYASKKSLLKHQEKMHGNVIIKYCSRCGEDCNCTGRIEEDYKETQEKAYTCEECNKTFEKEVKLEKHMRIHARAKEQQDTNFKRFLCHICSKTFRQNTGLMFHMRTHTGYKPHVCKYCGRGFTSNSNCINHERTHTGDRPFVCHFCSAAFAKSCTLKAHITTHTGEANYHCKTCGKSFRRLKYLKEHRFTHTGEKPYACKICGTAYSHSGSLFVHEKKCRAQKGNYQAITVPVVQNYREPLMATSSIAPITTSLPSSHHISLMDTPLTADATKSYIESVPRMKNNLIHPANNMRAGAHI